MNVPRLLSINALIRIAAAASGQLFAFLVATRLGARPGVGSAVVGLLGAAFFVTELFGAPFAGRLADRYGHRRILRTAPLFGIASSLVAAIAAFGHLDAGLLVSILLIARFNEGASGACAVPTTLTLIARATDAEPVRRMRVMGLFEITSLLGMVTGFVVAGISWDAFGALSFLLLAPLYSAAWLLAGKAPAGEVTKVRAAAPVLATLRVLTAQRGSLAFGVSWLAVNAVVGVWMQQGPYLLKLPTRSTMQLLVGGHSGQSVGLIFAVWGLVFLTGLLLWSIFGARLPRRRTLAIALLGMIGVVITLALVNHGAPNGLLVLAAVFILVESGYTPAAFSHLADLSERHDASRGTALGLYSFVLAAGQLAGNVVGAPFAARWQMDGVLLVTALLAIVSLAGVARMRVPRATT